MINPDDILKCAINAGEYSNTDPNLFANYDGLLFIDDLGREHFTEKGFGISVFDKFFDTRYRHMRPTLITTNLNKSEFISKYNERIYDRLKESAKWITVKGESLRESVGRAV